jgi:4-carboxymuconolactone decarboxylase
MPACSSTGYDRRSGRVRPPACALALLVGLVAGHAHAIAQQPAAPTAPPGVEMVGNRFAPLTWETMSDEQRRVVRTILDGPRNSLGGPFNVMLRSPEVADRVQALGALARFNETLPPALRELAIILTARHWTSHFEWYAHKRAALAAGLDATVVDAIAAGRRPERMSDEETAIYDFCRQLLENGRVDDPAFETAVAAFGERGVVDAITTVGYYSMVSMFLNVDEYPLPDGVEPELQPLVP